MFLFLAQFSRLYRLEKAPEKDLTAAAGRLAADVAASGLPGNSKALAGSAAAFRPTVSALNLNLTPRCNLSCVYCYAKGGDYARLEKEMKPETVFSAVAEAMPFIDGSREFRFEFFGGEPLLNAGTVEGVLEWEKTGSGLKNRVVNRISTNLTVYDEKIGELLERGDFIISVSLDGGRQTQNSQRPYRDGSGSFDDIVANVARIKRSHPRLRTVARMTVYKNAGRLLGEIEELAGRDIFDYCSVYNATISEGGREVYMSDDFRRNFLAFAENYPRLLSAGIFKGCLELNRYICHIIDGTFALNHCRAGAGYFSLSPDGSVHPCHRLIGDPKFAVEGGLAGVASVPDLWRAGVDSREKCSRCAIRYFCGGGCKQEALVATGDPLGVSPKSCEFSNLLFEAAAIAASRLNGAALRKVRTSCAELSEMFVLCGQNAARTCREELDRLVASGKSGYRVAACVPESGVER